jgi:flagella basal body P-ring formation protein FlgA
MMLLFALAAACLPVTSDRITAADVAQAVPAYRALPSTQTLSYAPLPGHTRVFPQAELKQRMPGAADLPASICFEWPMRTLSMDEVKSAMLSALPAGSNVAISGLSEYPVPPGPIQFPLTGLRNGVWKGYVVWSPGHRAEIWAQVTVKAPFSRVVAAAVIRPGQRIGAADVRVERGVGEPADAQLALDPENVVGRLSRRLIPQGAAIPPAALEKPITVARGDRVSVQVVAGNARLAFDGVAEGRGMVGDIVPVRNPATKRLLHARVEASGLLVADLRMAGENR